MARTPRFFRPIKAGLYRLIRFECHVVVCFEYTSFWRAQLGDRELVARLAELAISLGVPATILPWPALTVADKDPSSVKERWRARRSGSGLIDPDLLVLAVEPAVGENGILHAVLRTLLDEASTNEPSTSTQARPIHELPHGRRSGWWNPRVEKMDQVEGWLATPISVTSTKCRWTLAGADLSGTVVEVLTSEEMGGLDETTAVRLPGWAALGLRPGSPAGLLAARIADLAVRRGLPLWIPNVDEQALRLVLGLPGTIWVDGPAVPR